LLRLPLGTVDAVNDLLTRLEIDPVLVTVPPTRRWNCFVKLPEGVIAAAKFRITVRRAVREPLGEELPASFFEGCLSNVPVGEDEPLGLKSVDFERRPEGVMLPANDLRTARK